MVKDINAFTKEFRKEFDFYASDGELVEEIINDELDRRTWESKETNSFGSNESCYTIFDDMSTDDVKEFREIFMKNMKHK